METIRWLAVVAVLMALGVASPAAAQKNDSILEFAQASFCADLSIRVGNAGQDFAGLAKGAARGTPSKRFNKRLRAAMRERDVIRDMFRKSSIVLPPVVRRAWVDEGSPPAGKQVQAYFREVSGLLKGGPDEAALEDGGDETDGAGTDGAVDTASADALAAALSTGAEGMALVSDAIADVCRCAYLGGCR